VLTALGKTNSDAYLVGGDLGFLGASTAPSSYTAQVADLAPVSTNGNSGGALRFTNGSPYGYHENGAIVSDFVFPTAQGLEITFKTVTYGGDNQGGHGADGISFYLLDGCMPIAGGTIPTTGCLPSTAYNTTTNGASISGTTFSGIGAWGGSLAYSCSNSNPPFDGLAGGYLALGIDEWGNFLNGVNNTLSETGSTNTGGDNTASGGYYQPGRIGLRGAGNISWLTLNNAYSSYSNTSSPYYPTSLATSCYIKGGTYSSSTGLCSGNPTDAMMAVQETCANGTLYNFANNSGTVSSYSVNHPTSAGATTLTNTVNTAKILDYLALPSAYEVVTAFSIANESATIRGSTLVANTSTHDANPITYDLKITPTNLLSLSVSYNGGAFQSIISGQDITASNGTPPAWFRFGFAGSTGGSTNIHEILCFKAAPGNTSSSSGGVNTFQNPQLNQGSTQVYLAYYNPSDWTGSMTATSVYFNTSTNSLALAATPTWDARCVLSGATATTPCSTGSTSMSAEAPASRVMLTWNGTAGISFEWNSLSTAEKATLTAGDSSEVENRLDFLRGTTTNYISSTGTCQQLTSPGWTRAPHG
jgi:type IV pilus assembly protein PilY1